MTTDDDDEAQRLHEALEGIGVAGVPVRALVALADSLTARLSTPVLTDQARGRLYEQTMLLVRHDQIAGGRATTVERQARQVLGRVRANVHVGRRESAIGALAAASLVAAALTYRAAHQRRAHRALA